MGDLMLSRKGSDLLLTEMLRARPIVQAVASALGNQRLPTLEKRTLVRKGVRRATGMQKVRE